MEKPKNHDHSIVPKQTASLYIITVRKKHGWTDSFENLFHKHSVPEVWAFLKERELPQKAVLLLHNVPSHPRQIVMTSDNSLIDVKFLPPNVTAIIIQPTDQGMIASMK
jgi:ribosomal protein S8